MYARRNLFFRARIHSAKGFLPRRGDRERVNWLGLDRIIRSFAKIKKARSHEEEGQGGKFVCALGEQTVPQKGKLFFGYLLTFFPFCALPLRLLFRRAEMSNENNVSSFILWILKRLSSEGGGENLLNINRSFRKDLEAGAEVESKVHKKTFFEATEKGTTTELKLPSRVRVVQ